MNNINPLPPNGNHQNACTAIIALGVSLHFDKPEVSDTSFFDGNPPSFGADCAAITADPKYRRQVEHLHSQGPRSTGELLAEFAATHGLLPEIRESLARYAAIPHDALTITNGHCFPPDPIYGVAR